MGFRRVSRRVKCNFSVHQVTQGYLGAFFIAPKSIKTGSKSTRRVAGASEGAGVRSDSGRYFTGTDLFRSINDL